MGEHLHVEDVAAYHRRGVGAAVDLEAGKKAKRRLRKKALLDGPRPIEHRAPSRLAQALLRGEFREMQLHLQFHAFFPAPGRYNMWAEFAAGDDHLTADFVIEVAGTQGVKQ